MSAPRHGHDLRSVATTSTGVAWPRLLAPMLLVVLLASSCGVHGLNFYEDTRVEIRHPSPNSTVELPFELSWDYESVDGAFAVLVDREPPPPGRDISWLFRNDRACAAAPGCPDEDYLADRDIYLTTGTSVTIGKVGSGSLGVGGDASHEATIILLSADGTRMGESAFTVQFKVSRADED